MKKTSSILILLAIGATACTQQMNHEWETTQKAWHNYPFTQNMREFLGINEIAPDNHDKRNEIIKKACQLKQAENRVLNISGSEHPRQYLNCPFSQAPDLAPSIPDQELQ